MKNDRKNTDAGTGENTGFKKVMHGYDPKEVDACIGKITQSMQDAAKNYEMRMAEMNQELTFVNRERELLKEKCAALEKKAAESAERLLALEQKALPAEEQNACVPNGVITYTPAGKTENVSERTDGQKDEQLRQANEQIAQLSFDIDEKEKQLAVCLNRISALEEQQASRETLRSEYEDALAVIEVQKSENSRLREQCERMEEDAKNAQDGARKGDEEKLSLKTELSRLSVENSLLAEANEKYKRECAEIRAEAKTKAYKAAEKLSAQEDEFSREKLRLKKQLQLQSYHIEQADAALGELKNQLERIRSAFSDGEQ